MRLRTGALLSLITLAVAPRAAISADVRVVDGDTLELRGSIIRLHGIDAPEAGQTCLDAHGNKWKCGKTAIAALENLVTGQVLKCEARSKDPYNRVIAVCETGSLDLSAELVRQGKAWAFLKYSNDYESQQSQAKKARIGIWSADNEAPWDFRAKLWAVAEQASPDGCPIKGNISKKGGRIYHAPWSPWYHRTRVSVADGERWFCDERQAIEAGWRAPFWGR